MKKKKIIIFTIDCSYSTIYLESLLPKIHQKVPMICISDRFGGDHGNIFSHFLSYWKNSGIKYVNYLGAVFVYYKPLNYILNKLSSGIPLKRKYRSIKQMADYYNIPVMMVSDINVESVENRIRQMEPDLILSAYFDQIMKKNIFSIPELGTINFHPGVLPAFPGPAASFWAMKHDKAVGSTIHYVDSGIDTGKIISQDVLRDLTTRSVLGADYQIFSRGAHYTLKAITMIENGTDEPLKQDGDGTYYSYPTPIDIAEAAQKKVRIFSFRDFLKYFLPLKQAAGE